MIASLAWIQSYKAQINRYRKIIIGIIGKDIKLKLIKTEKIIIDIIGMNTKFRLIETKKSS
jgi:hypothetical protein